MEDAALLCASAAGDTRAFGHFVHAHEAAVHRYLRIHAGPVADVDDALQETFIAAWRGASTFRGPGSAKPWLFAIARNALRHLVRRRVGEPAQMESLDALSDSGSFDELAVEAGWGCPADERMLTDAALAREMLEIAMQRLPVEEREILTLRELDGFSGAETADLLQISLPAMKSRLHRARLHLAASLRLTEFPSHRSGLHA